MTTNPRAISLGGIFATFARHRELALVVFIVALVALVGLRTPGFLSPLSFRLILLDVAVLGMVSLGQAATIITRGIDLSVASMLALTAMMVSFMIRAFPHTPVILTVFLGMGLGLALGSLNGVIIAVGGVPPIIATLGTLSVYRGLVFLYSNGTWINAFEMPESFKQLAKGEALGLPNLVLVAAGVALLAYLFLNYTQAGRDIYALGSNPEAAAIAGIRTQRITFLVYALSGVICGLAGVMWSSRYEAAQTNTALGYELETVAAAVIGGVSLAGGSGTVAGVVLGSLLLGVIENGLTVSRISPFWELAVQGLLILLAVISDSTLQRRRVMRPGNDRGQAE